MRFGRRARPLRVLAVEITPMIDVVFLLIIFFMTTARFSRDTRADLELPRERGEQQETAEEAGIVINVDAGGQLIVAARTVTLDELDRLVRAEIARQPGRDPAQVKLMIRADRNGATDRLNEVIALAEDRGGGGPDGDGGAVKKKRRSDEATERRRGRDRKRP